MCATPREKAGRWGFEDEKSLMRRGLPADHCLSLLNLNLAHRFRGFEQNRESQTSSICSAHVHVHVHVSFEDPYTLEQVQRVAKAAIWFEDALFGLLPSRRGSVYCSRIVSADMVEEETFRPIDFCENVVEVANESSPLILPTCTTEGLVHLSFGSRHRGTEPTALSVGPSSVHCCGAVAVKDVTAYPRTRGGLRLSASLASAEGWFEHGMEVFD